MNLKLFPKSLAKSEWTPENCIRVFPYRTKWTPTDALSFIGECPLFPPSTDLPVLVSVTFSWHLDEAERIAATWRERFSSVTIGGPALDDSGGDFMPGLFLPIGCTITSRGCPKKCGYCSVPYREGPPRLLPVKAGWIVQDNNLLALPEHHVRSVFDMLKRQPHPASFNGGLDKHFLQEWHRELFDGIRTNEFWFACDTGGDFASLERVARIMDGISIEKMRCYTMIGYDSETPLEAERRIERVYKTGFLPFCQLYQPLTVRRPRQYPEEWKRVHRKWSRPAAYRSNGPKEVDGLFGDRGHVPEQNEQS